MHTKSLEILLLLILILYSCEKVEHKSDEAETVVKERMAKRPFKKKKKEDTSQIGKMLNQVQHKAMNQVQSRVRRIHIPEDSYSSDPVAIPYGDKKLHIAVKELSTGPKWRTYWPDPKWKTVQIIPNPTGKPYMVRILKSTPLSFPPGTKGDRRKAWVKIQTFAPDSNDNYQLYEETKDIRFPYTKLGDLSISSDSTFSYQISAYDDNGVHQTLHTIFRINAKGVTLDSLLLRNMLRDRREPNFKGEEELFGNYNDTLSTIAITFTKKKTIVHFREFMDRKSRKRIRKSRKVFLPPTTIPPFSEYKAEQAIFSIWPYFNKSADETLAILKGK